MTESKTNTFLSLPVLSDIPPGEYSLGIPITDGRVQIGSTAQPDSFDRLNVTVTNSLIEMARAEGDLQVSARVFDHGTNGKHTTKQTDVLVSPQPSLRFTRRDGQWSTDARVASRLGLSRFAAKVGEAAVRKEKNSRLEVTPLAR